MNLQKNTHNSLTTKNDTQSLFLLGWALSLSITIILSFFISMTASILSPIVLLGLVALGSDLYYTRKNTKHNTYEILFGGVTASMPFSRSNVLCS